MSLSASPGLKNLKKGVQSGPKLNVGPAPKRAIRHFSSADWHKCGPRPKGT